ncbi:hypothetical protein MBM_03676 [Drepanopeziza brunnea f. sp. 'multigermtubi' MB_m1]|uniref:Uncharacterized protein n=1 Tax=Marssonina brunnea f. sp. multigermtubi (strain MB_m1) TaxID=1072389 RepID=K1XYI8_MARBU|nr:uncharacterized protein MBM_03676 [Drepanopeziza brunnea f. sp. 'multigermtubi' MB_m1]EKD17904.1 hypothetical protein MBM_03676 [Drepanopeziza brunnea f. sp. 'multigermtubi' MB_m1]
MASFMILLWHCGQRIEMEKQQSSASHFSFALDLDVWFVQMVNLEVKSDNAYFATLGLLPTRHLPKHYISTATHHCTARSTEIGFYFFFFFFFFFFASSSLCRQKTGWVLHDITKQVPTNYVKVFIFALELSTFQSPPMELLDRMSRKIHPVAETLSNTTRNAMQALGRILRKTRRETGKITHAQRECATQVPPHRKPSNSQRRGRNTRYARRRRRSTSE